MNYFITLTSNVISSCFIKISYIPDQRSIFVRIVLRELDNFSSIGPISSIKLILKFFGFLSLKFVQGSTFVPNVFVVPFLSDVYTFCSNF